MAILVASSELEELAGICHRIVVLRRGRIAAEFQRSEFSKERIIAAAAIDQVAAMTSAPRPRDGLAAVQLRLADSPELGIIAAVAIAFAFFTSKNPLFASSSELQNLGIDLAEFGILAIGESFAIITGGIDLGVGSLTA